MEGIPQYGPVLAATDSDAVAWCLNWDRGSADSSPRGWTESMDLRYPKSEISLSETMRNNFSLSSTRNLVARTHILLDVAPLVTSSERLKGCRTQCEALLLLCDMLSNID